MNKQVHFLPFASLPEVPRGKGIVNYLIAPHFYDLKKENKSVVGIFAFPLGALLFGWIITLFL